MRIVLQSLIVHACLVACVLGQSAEPGKLKTIYEPTLQAYENEHTSTVAVAIAGYTNELHALRIRVQQAQELDSLKVILAEISRVEAQNTLPSGCSSPSVFEGLVAAYRRQVQHLDQSNTQEVVQLAISETGCTSDR
jgi:hypothetical protein